MIPIGVLGPRHPRTNAASRMSPCRPLSRQAGFTRMAPTNRCRHAHLLTHIPYRAASVSSGVPAAELSRVAKAGAPVKERDSAETCRTWRRFPVWSRAPEPIFSRCNSRWPCRFWGEHPETNGLRPHLRVNATVSARRHEAHQILGGPACSSRSRPRSRNGGLSPAVSHFSRAVLGAGDSPRL